MRIDMFVYNRCTTDARVLKEARTLADAGHRVRIVAVLDATTEPVEERDGFGIVRIARDPIHYRALRAARRLWRAPARVRRAVAGGAPVPADAADEASEGRPGTSPARRVRRGGRRLLLAPHKPLMFLDYYRRAYRLVRSDPPQALHAHDLNTLPVAAALARRLRLPLTYDAHELYPEVSTLSRREATVWRLLERRLAKRADHVLTVCDSIAAEIEARCGIARPTVLLNCPAGSEPSRRTAAIRPASGGEPTVLYQGGFAPHRGLETLVRAAHDLDRGTIVLMGWGPLEGELRALIAAEGLAGRVRIVPPVRPAEVVAQAAVATLGAIPYEPVGLNNTYTTPNKLFDYMAAGLPIVASRLPELTRFVEGNAIGLTFDPGDAGSLAAALNELLADPARRETMRERARGLAGRYTWERESRKLLALYEGDPGARGSPSMSGAR